jgi:hypothetical protein
MEAQRDKPRVPMKRRIGSNIDGKITNGVDFANYENQNYIFAFKEQ